MKKILCFILCTFIALSMAGCKKHSSPQEDTTKAPPVTAEETTAAPTADAQGTEKETTFADTTAAQTEPATEAVTDAPIVHNPTVGGHGYPTVLMYHLILDEPYTEYTGLFVKVADFESHLKALINAGYSFSFADDFGPTDKKTVCLTFDDGYTDNYTNMFPLIKKYNVKATVFMIGYKVDKPGYLTSAQIKEMAQSGLVQFGSHTLSHPALSSLGEAAQKEELNGSHWILSELTGQPIKSICYPSGKYNDTTIRLGREKYTFGYTTNPGKYTNEDLLAIPRYGVPRGMTAQGLLNMIGG